MLEIIQSTKDNIEKYLHYVSILYDTKNYANINAKFQFVFKEKEDIFNYYIVLENGKVFYKDGIIEKANIVIETTLSVWYDISNGTLNGTIGFLTGKYKAKGNISLLLNFSKIFRKSFSTNEIPKIDDTIKKYEIKRNWIKPKKVLVINASPRKKEGYTFLYLNSFLKGMKKSDEEIEIIDIYDENIVINNCKGCEACWGKYYNQCVINDSANEIIKKINESYLTIYALPLYYDSMPAKLKALFERMFANLLPVFVPYKDFTRHPLKVSNEKYMVLFSVCGFTEIRHFLPLVKTFKDISINIHSPLIASILRPASQLFYKSPNYKYCLENILSSMEKAGFELINNGFVKKKTLKDLSNNFKIPNNNMRKFCNLYFYDKINKE